MKKFKLEHLDPRLVLYASIHFLSYRPSEWGKLYYNAVIEGGIYCTCLRNLHEKQNMFAWKWCIKVLGRYIWVVHIPIPEQILECYSCHQLLGCWQSPVNISFEIFWLDEFSGTQNFLPFLQSQMIHFHFKAGNNIYVKSVQLLLTRRNTTSLSH